jgi:colanic acid biosynthesis glycosyl transferase WcaI
MRVLLLILQFPPDVNSTGLLMAQVGEELVAHGHEVSVVTSFPHYEHFRVVDEYRGKLAQRRGYSGMDVLRLWVYASGTKQRMVHRLLSYLSFNALATVAGVLSRRSYDMVLCINGSFFTGITAHVMGLAKGLPFVYNVQDLYPETPVAAGQLRNRRAIAMLERLERFMYQKAAHVSVIAPSFRDNIVAKGIAQTKISVIPNFVDTEFIRPLPKANDFAAQHGLADKFVVTHAGNLGYVYDLDTLLDTAALLAAEKDIVFLIVGEGVTKLALQRKAETLSLGNVRFLPFQPLEALPLLRAASDVQVSLYKRGSARYSMPSKIYEIMASGRPLLASADPGSDVWNLVDSTACGICVEPEDAASLAQAVHTLYRDSAGREHMASEGRRQAEQTYSRQAVGSQYDELLRRVAPSQTDRVAPAGSDLHRA